MALVQLIVEAWYYRNAADKVASVFKITKAVPKGGGEEGEERKNSLFQDK